MLLIRRRFALFLACSICACVLACGGLSTPGPLPLPDGVLATITRPTRATWGPDGRLYVATLFGRIHAFRFGDDYARYYYEVVVEYEEPNYDDTNRHEEIEQFVPFRKMKIEIFFDDGRHQPIRAITLDTAIMGFERFSYESRTQNLYF